jgi:hypothetical protein
VHAVTDQPGIDDRVLDDAQRDQEGDHRERALARLRHRDQHRRDRTDAGHELEDSGRDSQRHG